MRILHVTECYEGGVSRAINKIAELTPEYDHFLLGRGRDSPGSGKLFKTNLTLSRNPLKRVLEVNHVAKNYGVDLIFAHSSWAGLYSRLLKPYCSVVYEPHCYVFDDPNRPKLMRSVYYAVEKFLTRRTKVTVALTQHEEKLATSLDETMAVVRLPNVPTINVSTTDGKPQNSPEVVMTGRLVRQKDPRFFAEVARTVRLQDPAIRFTWIGDGDDEYRSVLEAENVEITGWLNNEDLADRLSRASVYFHSAKYEGFPLSLLDAAASRLPIIVRHLPCFDGFALRKVRDDQQACEAIIDTIRNQAVRAGSRMVSAQLLATMNPDAQRNALVEIFQEVANGA